MIEVKTIDLIGPALDWAVAHAIGEDNRIESDYFDVNGPRGGVELITWCWNRYSTDWALGGPLIVEHRVSVIFSDDDALPCAWTDNTGAKEHSSYLVAACRAIVAAKLGDVVSIPDELAS